MVATNDDILAELKKHTSLLAGLYGDKLIAKEKIEKSETILTELIK